MDDGEFRRRYLAMEAEIGRGVMAFAAVVGIVAVVFGTSYGIATQDWSWLSLDRWFVVRKP